MPRPLDLLTRSHVTPVLAEAGFTRIGRTHWRAAGNGDLVFCAVGSAQQSADQVRFRIRWSVLPITQWQWHSRNDAEAGPPDPNRTWLLTNDVPAPGAGPGALWSFSIEDVAERERCGGQLAAVLGADVVPWLVSMLDRDALLAELRAPTRPWMPGMSGTPRLEIIALLGHGQRSEIERRLPLVEEYSPEDNFREWVAERLDAS